MLEIFPKQYLQYDTYSDKNSAKGKHGWRSVQI